MNKIMNTSRILTIVLALLICFQNAVVYAKSQPEKHILILHPFTPIYPAHEQYNQGLMNKLSQNTKYKFNYSFEYLDFPRFSHDEGYLENIAQYLKLKYKNHQPDFIVTQANILGLLESYGQEIFPQVPVLIAQDRAGLPPVEGYFNYFFIQQSTDTEKNIELILQTIPKTKRIYIVIGDSEDERIFVSRLADIERKYKDRVELIFTNKMSYEQMMKTISTAEADSAILYFRWLVDAKGESFIPEQVIADICKASNVPVYGSDIMFLGSGIVGGYVREQKLAGEAAANNILDILNSKNINDVQRMREVKNTSAFDWRQLKKWEIDEGKLPEDSRIEYREISVWEQYKIYIFGGLVLISIEALLIFGLLVNRRRRKSAERELQKSNESLQSLTEKLINQDKIKDEFLTNTSHELQTPLNGIINITQTLAEGNYGSLTQRQKEELQVILAISRRLSSLTKDIIDAEKIKRNELNLQFVVVDVKTVLLLVVDVFKHLIQNKNIDILLHLPDKISPVIADQNRFIQVLYNLIGNAVKFTQNGFVKLSIVEENSFVKILIEDNGIGISKEVQAQIFEAFAQGGGEVSRRFGGSGLGLYISQKLLERMNGTITLEWSEPGKGTCFSITLPKSDEFPENALDEIACCIEVEETMEKNENKILHDFKVLAVDDEPTNLRVLKSLLIGEGYEVETALNGKEAIDVIECNHDIDLVLMDVMMPNMSGYEACKIIRDKYSLYDLPILILTVRDTPEDIAAGFEAGANDFVVKPFSAKELKARVATLLLMKQSVQQALKNEMAFLQAQIKPHFLFNALSTIMSLCYADGERAGELLSNLSEYLQKSFNIDNTNATVSLENELELTRAYVEIQKARFGNRLKVEFNLDEGLMGERVLPLTIQPIVENAIRHGLMTRIIGGTVKVEVKRVQDMLEIAVEDNGIGMDTTEAATKERVVQEKRRRTGVGLANIKKRLISYYGAELLIYSQKNEGTKVWFTIPSQNK